MKLGYFIDGGHHIMHRRIVDIVSGRQRYMINVLCESMGASAEEQKIMVLALQKAELKGEIK